MKGSDVTPESHTSDLNKARIGLVLSGGGGKGAYQIGCWKKLRALGLTNYTVISGTSVGALNAALIATGDLERAIDVWVNLREDKVLSTTALRKGLVFSLFILSTLVWEIIKDILKLTLVFFVAFFFTFAGADTWVELQYEGKVSFLQFLTTTSYISQMPVWLCAVLFAVQILMIGAAYATWVDLDFKLGKQSWNASLQSVALRLGRLFTIGTNEPLRKLVASKVRLSEVRQSTAKVYVNVSVFETYLDPFTPRYRRLVNPRARHDGPSSEHSTVILVEPGWRSQWMSQLVELTSLATDGALNKALIQSANLPLVFAEGDFMGKRSVDGGIDLTKGISQNAPLLPAVREKCDFIIVVYLSENVDTRLAAAEETVTLALKMEFLRRLNPEKAQEMYWSLAKSGFPDLVKFDFTLQEQQLISVVPSKSLGSVVDFSGGGHAKALIELGEQDMETVVKSHPIFADFIEHRKARR
jgi:predicted acylesterase/phospholipase RssA